MVELIHVSVAQGERNRGYALLMTANKPETALYRAPTLSLLLASHGVISSCMCINASVFADGDMS